MNEQKDFSKFAYFRSRARNYAVCIRPERKATVDGESVTKDPGLRVEFNNHLLRIRKDEEGQQIIQFLRDRMLVEAELDQNKRMLFEEKPEDILIPESDVNRVIEEKNKEIKRLKEQLGVNDKEKEEVDSELEEEEEIPNAKSNK